MVTDLSGHFPIVYVDGESKKYEVEDRWMKRNYSPESRNLLYETL